MDALPAPTVNDQHTESFSPIGPYGLPDRRSVRPGQPDNEVMAYIAAWAKTRGRTEEAARRVYAGILSKTQPKEAHYPGPASYRHAYDTWLKGCTPLQIEIFRNASRAKWQKVKEAAREESRLMQKKRREEIAASEGRTLREYVVGRSDKDKRRRNAERQAKFRAAKKAEKEAAERFLEELLAGTGA